jgi:hypothetical protein
MQVGLIGVDFKQTLRATYITIFEAFLLFLLCMTQSGGLGELHIHGGKLGKNEASKPPFHLFRIPKTISNPW